MVALKPNLNMAMAITCMLKSDVLTSCYEGVNSSNSDYFNALLAILTLPY